MTRRRPASGIPRCIAWITALLCAVVWVTPALAQDKEEDAERLFREGQKLMGERRYGEACFKFNAAYEKDHELGTLLNLAYCHKMQGATWQAWVEFKEAEVKATEMKRGDRRDFARKRMAELEKGLVHVVVDRQDAVELTEVLVEDRRVPEAEKSVVFAAEAGPRKVTFKAKGKKPVTQLVTMGVVKGERLQHIAVPPMEEPEKEKPVVAVEPPAPEQPEPHKPAKPDAATAPMRSEQRSSQRTVAIVLAGVGAAGVAVGTVTGVLTLTNDCATSGKDDHRCPTDPKARADAKDRGRTTGRVSDVSFAVGGAALVGAVVLYVTAPARSATTSVGSARMKLWPDIGPGWAALRGEF